jgi:hypothetical protein
MSMIHVNRNRETLGKFTDQEVADGLKSGRLLPSDLAWKEPMPGWQTLSTFPDLPEASEDHAEVLEGEAPDEEVKMPAEVEPAWERSGGLSVGGAFQTIRQIFSNPVSTFKSLPASGRIGRAFLYFMLFSVVGSSFAIFYDYIATSINPESFLDRLASFPPIYDQVKQLTDSVGTKQAITAIFVSSMVAQPVFLLGWIFVFSLVAHFFLMLAGAAGKSFSATFKALAYALGTGFLLQMMPLVGVPLSWVAFLVLGTIAVKEVHQTSLWRVGVASLLMVVLSCGLLMAMGFGLSLMTGALAPKG